MYKKTITSLFILLTLAVSSTFAQQKPNILWIYAEDTSPWMGCYGDNINEGFTPNIDGIAQAGVLFHRAFVPAPVCSATRSAMMIGQSAICFDAHEHRSSRTPETRIYLPEGYQLLPEIMQAHGYSTFNHGKCDYNFAFDQKAVYDVSLASKTDFSNLVDRQPFFGQIQTKGGKNNTSKMKPKRKVDPKSVSVPADYPNNEIFQDVVAQHYDAMRMDDALIGKILSGLKEAGLDKNTIVVYFSDHGANNLLRHKQMTTEGGLHVPFMIMGPKAYVPQKATRNDLVSMLDLSATTLAWAGIPQPEWYEGQNLFADDLEERTVVGAHKDRLDHTIDRVRSIRTENYRYVRNYKLDRIFLQPQYRDKQAYTKNLRALYAEGQLSEELVNIYFGERPKEELYNVVSDPEMIHNLANTAKYKKELKKHRHLMDEWLERGDKGAGEESIAELKANGEDKAWGEGVNVEYEVYREDTDGDGLSDKWETLNNRDPEDGRLCFKFDCGGWQTEGWTSENISSNLAGKLGFLDFSLDKKTGTIERKGLSIKANEGDKALLFNLRCNEKMQVSAMANNKLIGRQELKGDNNDETITLPLNQNNWNGEINSISLAFKGKKGSLVEIDFIEINR